MNYFKNSSDSYIRNLLYKSNGEYPSKELINKYRNGLIRLREVKRARKNYQKIQIDKIMKEGKIEKWKGEVALKTTPEMTTEEKQRVYVRRSEANRYLQERLTKAEYENLIGITPKDEEPKNEEFKCETVQEIERRFLI